MQVAHLEILAKLYILRYQYADAAAVYETLAVRKQGLGDEAVDLSERVEMYRSAVLQVRAPKPACTPPECVAVHLSGEGQEKHEHHSCPQLYCPAERWLVNFPRERTLFSSTLHVKCVYAQAKSQGNSDMIDRLDVRCRLMELQQRLVSDLEASSPQVLPLLMQGVKRAQGKGCQFWRRPIRI